MDYFFFIIILIYVICKLFYELIKVLKWEFSWNFVKILISLFATIIVFLGFLTYTIAYLVGYRFFNFLDVYAEYNIFVKVGTALRSKSFYELITYFAALAALFDYLHVRYETVKSTYIKNSVIKEKRAKIESDSRSLREDIRLRLILLESYKKTDKGLKQLEEQTKYEFKTDLNKNKDTNKLKDVFKKIDRPYGDFILGDIIITTDERVLKVGNDLSIQKANELLETGYLKTFYPTESSIELQ